MNDQLQPTEIHDTRPDLWAERSESVGKLAPALSKAQATIEAVAKDASNPFFKSKYADLASVWAAIRKPLTDNGLCILQEPSTNGVRLILTTTLLHSSGEYVRSALEFPVMKQDPQGYGSAITYARRYALGAIVGIAPEDDDGNAASGKTNAKSRPNPYEEESYAPRAEPSIRPDPTAKLNPKQKLTLKAIEGGKAYQWDLNAIGNNCKDQEEKAAVWKIGVRDFGAIAKDSIAFTLEYVEEWHDYWLNEMEMLKKDDLNNIGAL